MAKGKVEVFQVGKERYVLVRPIPGSPSYMVEECYPTTDSPTGWYSSLPPLYTVGARTTQEAAQEWIDNQQTREATQ